MQRVSYITKWIDRNLFTPGMKVYTFSYLTPRIPSHCDIHILTDLESDLKSIFDLDPSLHKVVVINIDENTNRSIMNKEWFLKLFAKGRHYNITTFVLLSDVKYLTPRIRAQCEIYGNESCHS